MNAYRKDEFDTGERRDGHRILRHVCDEDGIEIVHPASCRVEEDFKNKRAIPRDLCPWNMVFESYESVLHAFVDGRESPTLADLDVVLPRGVEIPVVWRYSGGASWTDYGWEYDAEWWFDSEVAASTCELCGAGPTGRCDLPEDYDHCPYGCLPER
jgi:hypothetical protein